MICNYHYNCTAPEAADQIRELQEVLSKLRAVNRQLAHATELQAFGDRGVLLRGVGAARYLFVALAKTLLVKCPSV